MLPAQAGERPQQLQSHEGKLRCSKAANRPHSGNCDNAAIVSRIRQEERHTQFACNDAATSKISQNAKSRSVIRRDGLRLRQAADRVVESQLSKLRLYSGVVPDRDRVDGRTIGRLLFPDILNGSTNHLNVQRGVRRKG